MQNNTLNNPWETTSTNGPRVSVCIPVRNGAQFIGQAISSVLEQSYPDFEVVIVDNCSTDNTASMVHKIALRDRRIRFYSNDHDLGLVGNLNVCLQYTRGNYVKFVLADDMLMPGCLDMMVRALDEQPSVVLVTAGRRIVDEVGRPLALRRYSAKRAIVAGDKVIQRCVFGGNYIGEPTAVMFRRCDVNRGFSAALTQLTDLEMWFHLLERGDMLSIPEPLSIIRWHTGQLTNANVKSSVLIEDNIKLFEQFRYKPYIKSTFLLALQHKLLMSLRLWQSRNYLPDERRRFITKHYSNRLTYYGLAPLASLNLYLWRLMKRK